MTTYHRTGLFLSAGQQRRLLRAYDHRCAATLRLDPMQLQGPHVLMLTKRQQRKIHKADQVEKGVELKISKTQMKTLIPQRGRDGGSLFSAVVPLARTLAPHLGKNPWALSTCRFGERRSESSCKKDKWNGMKGGFLIPQDKIQKLLDNNIC